MEYILPLLVLMPLLGIALVYLSSKISEEYPKWVALGMTIAIFLASLVAWKRFDYSEPGYQLVTNVPWIKSLGVNFLFGVDGVSMPLLLLTTFVFITAVGISWRDISKKHFEQPRPTMYYSLLLLNEVGLMGVFIALDFFLFFVFWEIVLVPMYLLIAQWGGPRREYASIKFFIYTHLGGLFMLLGIIATYLLADVGSFSMIEIARVIPLKPQVFTLAVQVPIFIALFIGFAFKMPLVPFHTWLPDAHGEAPTAGSVILAGLLLKMGGYGVIRLGIMMLPDAAIYLGPALVVIALITIYYGALLAMAQQDLKYLIACSSISHMGYVLLGVAALNELGIGGATYQMVSHGFISALLFMLAGTAHHLAHTRIIGQLGGLSRKMPVFATTLFFASMASLGLPALSGFVAEFMVVVGAFQVFRLAAALAVLAIIITAAYYLWMIKRAVYGEPSEHVEKGHDIEWYELAPMIVLMIAIVIYGVYPPLLLDMVTATNRFIEASFWG